MKGLYIPHSWKLIGLFTTHSILCVGKWSNKSESLGRLAPFPDICRVCGRPKGLAHVGAPIRPYLESVN